MTSRGRSSDVTLTATLEARARSVREHEYVDETDALVALAKLGDDREVELILRKVVPSEEDRF